MNSKRIFLCGHEGFIGSAILQELKEKGYKKIITATKRELDLTNQSKTFKFFKKKKIDKVIVAAAKVGGIKANSTFPADFIYQNLSIQNNIIQASFINGVKDLIFLGSSCIYPKFAKQPIQESYLLKSELEKTNEAYAIAKISGVKTCEYYNKQYGTNYVCLMPCNVYGPNDNYNLETSHFLSALIKKIYIAKKRKKKFEVFWGTGRPKRELIYVKDVADACIYFLEKKTENFLINIGTEKQYSIKFYANYIKKKLAYKGKIIFDKTSPDGTKNKLLCCKLAKKYGWKPKYSFEKGLKKTLHDFKININKYI